MRGKSKFLPMSINKKLPSNQKQRFPAAPAPDFASGNASKRLKHLQLASTDQLPPFFGVEGGVANGTRTRNIQNHNLGLYH